MVVICGWHGLPRPGEGEITVGSVLQFSKERHIMDRTPERLKKELEEELLLSSEDLRSHAWYHGRIPRQVRSAPLRDSHSDGTVESCSETTERSCCEVT